MDYTEEGRIIREVFRLRTKLMHRLGHTTVYKITYVDDKLFINRYFIEMCVKYDGGYEDFYECLCKYIDLLMELRKFTDEELATSVKANGWNGEFDLNACLVLIASVIYNHKLLLMERNDKLLKRYYDLIRLLKTNKLKLITIRDSHSLSDRMLNTLKVYNSKKISDRGIESGLEMILHERTRIILRAEEELGYKITHTDSVSLFNSNLLNSVLNIEDNYIYASDLENIIKCLIGIINIDQKKIDNIISSKFELPYTIKPKEDLLLILNVSLSSTKHKESIANIRKYILHAGFVVSDQYGGVFDNPTSRPDSGLYLDHFIDFIKCLD